MAFRFMLASSAALIASFRTSGSGTSGMALGAGGVGEVGSNGARVMAGKLTAGLCDASSTPHSMYHK